MKDFVYEHDFFWLMILSIAFQGLSWLLVACSLVSISAPLNGFEVTLALAAVAIVNSFTIFRAALSGADLLYLNRHARPDSDSVYIAIMLYFSFVMVWFSGLGFHAQVPIDGSGKPMLSTEMFIWQLFCTGAAICAVKLARKRGYKQ